MKKRSIETSFLPVPGGAVIVTHTPSGRAKTFIDPRDAAAFIVECKEKGVADSALHVENHSGISLDVYTDRIPGWAQRLIENMERDYNVGVPSWHFINKQVVSSSGNSQYSRATGVATHIAISVGYDSLDFKGVLIHEYSHALTIGDSHGYRFYNKMFDLLRRYCTLAEEQAIMEREFRYKKASRYWYAERYNIVEILSTYRQPTPIAARRKTAEEKSNDLINDLF